MATRYKDRITILEDAEIEELYGRPRFTYDERFDYFALTPEERAVVDGHYDHGISWPPLTWRICPFTYPLIDGEARNRIVPRNPPARRPDQEGRRSSWLLRIASAARLAVSGWNKPYD